MTKDLSARAQRIYNTYLAVNAPLELNISRDVAREVEKVLKDKEQEVTTKLFDKVMSTVCINLSDTMIRFKETPEFTTFVKNKKEMEKLMRKTGMFEKIV